MKKLITEEALENAKETLRLYEEQKQMEIVSIPYIVSMYLNDFGDLMIGDYRDYIALNKKAAKKFLFNITHLIESMK